MASPKIALISGITGQDGAYLAEFLLDKGYIVHGIKRRSSLINTQRIDHIYEEPHAANKKFFLHYGDLTDSTNILRILQEVQPDEIYNLAAQTHVKVSFESPEYTANADAVGCLRFLEAIRILKMENRCRFYQASTSELFGKVQEVPQSEKTPFYPRSPYGVAKLYAYWICVNYRESYGMYAVNGILFNHESPLRGETFVTRKITRAAARISMGLQDCVHIGNLDARRDWGHTKEFIEGMWRILNHKTPEDFILATGQMTTVRDFMTMTFRRAGIELNYEGKGIDEVGRCRKTGKVMVRVDPSYFRPAEVEQLCGDASKAARLLDWRARVKVEELCLEMIEADLYRARQELGEVLGENKKVEELVHIDGSFLNWMRSQGIDSYAKK